MFRRAGENRASLWTTLLTAAALFGILLSANVNDATAASKYRSVTSGPAKVVIGTGKWSFGFRDKRSKPVLQEQPGTSKGPIGRLGFEVDGSWKHATKTIKSWKNGNSRFFRVATTDPTRKLDVQVTPADHGSVQMTASIANSMIGVEAIGMSFKAPKSERYLGFGERSNGVNQRGNVVESWVGEGPYQTTEYPAIEHFVPAWGMRRRADDTYFPMPWLLSTSGYGVLVENSEPSYFHLGTDNKNAWRVELRRTVDGLAQQPDDRPAPRSISLRFFPGPKPADVLRRMSGALGRQPSPAPFFFGPWLQTNESDSDSVDMIRNGDLPTSVYQTYLHYLPCAGQRGQEQGQIDRTALIHEAGLAITTYFNPMICTKLDSFAGLGASGQLTLNREGNPYEYDYLSYHVGQFDFTSEAARDSYGELLREALGHGYDGWMEDFGEYMPPDGVSSDGTPGMVEHNRYPLQYHCAAYDQTKSHLRPVLRFTRSGYTGSAACSPVVWGGDPSTSWDYDGLRDSIRNGLTMGLSGVGVWGSDIGGFFSIVAPRLSPELLTRWLQFGAFSGVMRNETDGLGKSRPQVTDPDLVENWRRYSKLRTQLYPYVRGAAVEYRKSGLPMMRAMVLDYPNDSTAAGLEDQYMFGDDLLVAPVIQEGQTSRKVYLPKGKWIDFWRSFGYDETSGAFDLTGLATKNGGGWRNLPAPIDQVPLLIRAGAAITAIAPDVDTLSPFGTDDTSIIHLEDRTTRTVFAFPRGTSSSRFEQKGTVEMSEGRGELSVRADDVTARNWTFKVATGAMKKPITPRCVKLGGKPLAASSWQWNVGLLTVTVPGKRKQPKLRISASARACG
ncbi:MAG: glycoside hydrolase family 31 protein [Thermoleophilales bacterium]|nr:glycoside hydrolase family 31 protein [Thermoleophilales bacterium]